MSQFFLDTVGGPAPPPPPNVATSYTTNYNANFTATGTAIPQANVLNVIGGSNSINNDNGIATQANPNMMGNLITLLTNRLFGAQTSSGTTPLNLITFTLTASGPAVYRFAFDITGRDTVSGLGVGYTLDGSARTDGTTATVIAVPFIDHDEDSPFLLAEIDLIVSGNSVILQVTGIGVETIAYKAVGTYVVV
jgi:hypothetical protein